jgi:hypothetical protein
MPVTPLLLLPYREKKDFNGRRFDVFKRLPPFFTVGSDDGDKNVWHAHPVIFQLYREKILKLFLPEPLN